MTKEDALEKLKMLRGYYGTYPRFYHKEIAEALDMAIKTFEQESKTERCRDCKHFECDSIKVTVDGVPLIVAHKICNKWGDGCQTEEDGYCFLFEPQESEDKKYYEETY